MTTTREPSDESRGRLSPSDVHNALLRRAGLGRRGYDEGEVDDLLERAEQELRRLVAEKADLRDELSRLEAQVAQGGAAPGAEQRARERDGHLVDTGLSRQELEDQVARLRTFGQVVRVHVTTHLEALLRDVEQEWARADPAVVDGAAPDSPAVPAAEPVEDDRRPDPDAPADGSTTARARKRTTVKLHRR